MQHVAHHQRAGVDKRIARFALLHLQLQQRVERQAGRLFADAPPDLRLLIARQRQRQAQHFGDRLNGEALRGVAGLEQFAVHRADGDRQPIGGHFRQRRDVVGHFPLANQRAHLLQDLLQQRVIQCCYHLGHTPGKTKAPLRHLKSIPVILESASVLAAQLLGPSVGLTFGAAANSV